MGTGQTLITMGALTLMSITLLNHNRAMMNTGDTLNDSRFRLEALSILTSHIEQLSQYYFDEASTDTTNAKDLADFTAPLSLGMEGNDSGTFDDIDDLHNATIADTGRSGVVYHVRYEVDYVNVSGNNYVPSSNREYSKRVRVSINDTFNPPMITRVQGSATVRDTIRLGHVVSYWFYN